MIKEAYGVLEGYNKKHNLEHNKDTVFPHLIEELGEMAREIYNEKANRREDFNKEKFGEELIDVLTQLLILAKDYDIDVEETFKKKISSLRERFELDK